MRTEQLTRLQARRVALAAQGFTDRTPTAAGGPGPRHLGRVLDRTGLFQIDSVNVLVRAHYLPLFSRLGPYDRGLLDRSFSRAPRRIVEYWAHVAAYMPVDLWPYMRHRMRHHRERGHEWVATRHDEALVGSLLAEVRELGPSTARDLDDGLPRTRTHWGWNWSETKKVLEYLFAAGELAIAGRNAQFERLYDLPERVLPRHVLDAPEPTDEEAHQELVRRAAGSLGVAAEPWLRDYYRLTPEQSQAAVRELVDAGELVPVSVPGWRRPAYLHHQARVPRQVSARALLSPFDPLVFERTRTEALFSFRYRIEIYVPAHLRVHGYYVLPFLLGDRLVARVDLKADRTARTLAVAAAHVEPQAPQDTAEHLAAELWRLAGWLGLDDVRVAQWGELAAPLGPAVRAAAGR